ncbi:hypothetical protein HA402_001768 [Bradysia odoriphaga]|nr:hypothetical protein HA402_001768 [Bradysia odoriphaga]
MKNLMFVLLIIAAVVSISLCQDADNLPQDSARCAEKPILQSLCRARKPRFYYKAETNECLDFFYGGCGANGNIFKTREDCEKLCKK